MHLLYTNDGQHAIEARVLFVFFHPENKTNSFLCNHKNNTNTTIATITVRAQYRHRVSKCCTRAPSSNALV